MQFSYRFILTTVRKAAYQNQENIKMCLLRLGPKMDLHAPMWLLSRNDAVKDSALQGKGILKER